MTRPLATGAKRSPRGQDPRTTSLATPRDRLVHADAALGLELTPGQMDALLHYAALLQHWGSVFNLTALRATDQVLTHHLLDCLAAVPALRRHAAGRPLRVLDVGSGAGLPGAVLAIAQPDWRVDCVDSAAKKASFVRQVAAELGLRNLHSWHARVEDLRVDSTSADRQARRQVQDASDSSMPHRGAFDAVISRAFASLADFVGRSGNLLAEGGVWIAMKGQPTQGELAGLPSDVELFHVEQLQVPGLDAQRCLVWVRPRAGTSDA